MIAGILLLANLVFLYMNHRQDKDQAPSVEAPQEEEVSVVRQKSNSPSKKKASKRVSTLVPKSVQRQARVAVVNNPGKNPETEVPPEFVQFEIFDGKAIAYGDVILGDVDAGADVKRGRARPPVPKPWDSEEIPYFITPDLPNPKRVLKAIQYFNDHTPVRFIPFSGQVDAIVFQKGKEHCFSHLGRVGGHQPIFLSGGCYWREFIHEMMHAMGFIHEHSRTDRSQFIQVVWDNIEPKYRSQFEVAPENFMDLVRGTEFDYQSAMIYPSIAFSKNKKDVTLKSESDREISPTPNGLSEGDIERLYFLFGN